MEIKNVITFGYAEKEENARKECEQAQSALEKWQKKRRRLMTKTKLHRY